MNQRYSWADVAVFLSCQFLFSLPSLRLLVCDTSREHRGEGTATSACFPTVCLAPAFFILPYYFQLAPGPPPINGNESQE
ncbi:hypothetical protein DFH94DRAFT_730982 [Russula ochroleuca]|uniref:Uncharacterized protein n=1 Tax=Russula ochroleuca TaxID=152965 RepID=A0A9P5N0K6_9AGAM|nr:hypothetical protein DFH94DRAFT_730982 [Russula ochroleuca]